jgi:hypothetical protein
MVASITRIQSPLYFVIVRTSPEIVYFVYDSQFLVPTGMKDLPEAWVLSAAIQMLLVFAITL